MGQLLLVRHGQASFGADDYDQLSDLGKRQSIRLGEYWRQAAADEVGAEALQFEAVLMGSLKGTVKLGKVLHRALNFKINQQFGQRSMSTTAMP